MKQRFRTALFILIATCMLFRPQLITAAAGLKEVTLPADIESLGDSAFSHCKELETIHFKGTKDQWEMIEKDKSWNKKSYAAMKIDYVSP